MFYESDPCEILLLDTNITSTVMQGKDECKYIFRIVIKTVDSNTCVRGPLYCLSTKGEYENHPNVATEPYVFKAKTIP